MTSDNPITILW